MIELNRPLCQRCRICAIARLVRHLCRADSQAQLTLERAFAALPPAYREVALLVGVEGLPPTEVAQILGQTPEAVRQRLARARTQLAEALGEHAPAAWRAP